MASLWSTFVHSSVVSKRSLLSRLSLVVGNVGYNEQSEGAPEKSKKKKKWKLTFGCDHFSDFQLFLYIIYDE